MLEWWFTCAAQSVRTSWCKPVKPVVTEVFGEKQKHPRPPDGMNVEQAELIQPRQPSKRQKFERTVNEQEAHTHREARERIFGGEASQLRLGALLALRSGYEPSFEP